MTFCCFALKLFCPNYTAINNYPIVEDDNPQPDLSEPHLSEKPGQTLFVCTANTCRSPMAETMFAAELSKKYNLPLGELSERGLRAGSAGYFGYKKRVITDNTVQVLLELGYQPPLGRISEALTPELIDNAKIVYAMTRWHIDLVLEVNPSAREKVFLLGGDRDIDDPIGSDLNNYRQVGLQIQSAIKAILRRY